MEGISLDSASRKRANIDATFNLLQEQAALFDEMLKTALDDEELSQDAEKLAFITEHVRKLKEINDTIISIYMEQIRSGSAITSHDSKSIEDAARDMFRCQDEFVRVARMWKQDE